ncbi:cell division protein ZipA [Halomonas sp. WWR20]
MELREWLIILGLVLVTIIVIDGVRRLQRQRRVPRLDLAASDKDTEGADSAAPVQDPEDAAREAEVNWELPNGGARVVRPATFDPSGGARRTHPESPRRTERIPEDQLKPSVIKKRRGFKEAMRSRTLRRDVAEPHQEVRRAEDDFAQPPEAHANAQETSPLRAERDEPTELTARENVADQERVTARQDAREAPRYSQDPQAPDEVGVEDDIEFGQAEAPRHEVVTQHPAVERAKRHHVSAARARETLADADEVIVISVLSRNEEGFHGPDLLHLVLACGLRYSEMGIFHRYETEAEDSELQFSMVNVLKPGVFDLDAMDEGFSTPGVTFLMPLPGANDTAAAFEAMIETAMVLVRNLGGELKDENRSVMTAQTIEFARQRVQEFERRHRLHRYQAN